MFRIKQSVVVVAVVAVAGSLAVGANAALKPLPRPVVSYLGEVSLDDSGLLTLDVNQVAGRGAQTLLLGREARLLTGATTRIASAQGGPVARALLDHATVRVQGRLLPVSAWPLNDEGQRQPSIRASQIIVLQLQAADSSETENTPTPDTSETTNQD